MKKYLFMITIALTSSSCVASIAELNKAIKKSNVQKVGALSKILRLTQVELNSFISLAHDTAQNRQLDIQTFKLAKHPPINNKVSKNYFICGLLGLVFAYSSLAFGCYIGNKHDSVGKMMLIAALGGFVTSIIFIKLAEKATGKYLRKRYSDAQDVQRIIQCWPLIR